MLFYKEWLSKHWFVFKCSLKESQGTTCTLLSNDRQHVHNLCMNSHTLGLRSCSRCAVGARMCYTDSRRCIPNTHWHRGGDSLDSICCLLVGSSSEKTFQRWVFFHEHVWFIPGSLTCGWAYYSQFIFILQATAAWFLRHWRGRGYISFSPPRNRCFISIRCSNPRSVS